MTEEFLQELGIAPETAEKILAESQKETQGIQLEHAVRDAVKQKNPKNLEVALSLLNREGLTLQADGVDGLAERIAALEKEHSYLFGAEQPRIVSAASGGAPTGISSAQFAKMGYQERVRLYQKDPELYRALTGNDR